MTNYPFKVEIRKLPPHLSEDQFQISLSPHSDDILFQYYVQGKIKYITFTQIKSD